MKTSIECPDFGWQDYWRMAKARGPKLPLRYFIEAQWFDLRHGTDTHSWIPMSGYMVSWSSEIRRSLSWLHGQMGSQLDRFQFLDPGCGKGKPCLMYAMNGHLQPQHPAVGIDYCEDLIAVARRNQQVLDDCLHHSVRFVHADASIFPEFIEADRLLVYLYNPLSGKALSDFVEKISDFKAILIYNYPVHVDLYRGAGFDVIRHWQGFHPNATTTILANCLPVSNVDVLSER